MIDAPPDARHIVEQAYYRAADASSLAFRFSICSKYRPKPRQLDSGQVAGQYSFSASCDEIADYAEMRGLQAVHRPRSRLEHHTSSRRSTRRVGATEISAARPFTRMHQVIVYAIYRQSLRTILPPACLTKHTSRSSQAASPADAHQYWLVCMSPRLQ